MNETRPASELFLTDEEYRQRAGNNHASDSNHNYRPLSDISPSGTSRERRFHNLKGFRSSADFGGSMLPPDYVVDGVIMRGSVYTMTGNTGHCKTLIALSMAIAVARGAWFCGRECQQGTVAFFAGENPENVKMQFRAMCWEMQVDWRTLDIAWHEGLVTISRAMDQTRAALRDYPNLALCVYDSLQAFFSGDDDSANVPMLEAARDFRLLTIDHPARPTGLILAHPVKNATRDNLLPRGGSALNNELDGNLTTWLDTGDNIATLHWHGKLRGAPFAPMKFENVLVKPEGLVNAKGDQMPCRVVKPLGNIRAAELAQTADAVLTKILAAIRDIEGITQRQIGVRVGVSVATVNRRMEELSKLKWVRSYRGRLVITNEGKKALQLTNTVSPEPSSIG
jgi:hypothetical protein